jgi:RNA-directed DNA polymerase
MGLRKYLRINTTKPNFDFLGWNFRKYKGKLLIKPSKKSIEKITEKISNTIKNGKTWKQEVLIDTLNPFITGWANYHRSVVSSEIFQKLDCQKILAFFREKELGIF